MQHKSSLLALICSVLFVVPLFFFLWLSLNGVPDQDATVRIIELLLLVCYLLIGICLIVAIICLWISHRRNEPISYARWSIALLASGVIAYGLFALCLFLVSYDPYLGHPFIGSCLTGSELKCMDGRIVRQSAQSVQGIIEVRNNLDEPILFVNQSDWKVRSTYSTSNYCAASKQMLASGEDAVITCNLTGEFPPKGNKIRLSIDLYYAQVGNLVTYPAAVEVVEEMH
jgi:amino acid transporter